MSGSTIRLVRFLFIIAVAGGFMAQQSRSQDFGSLDGAWEGELKVVATSNSRSSDSLNRFPYRLLIQAGKVRVFFNQMEIKPSAFRIEQHMTNALVFAMNSGKDTDGTWVETWAFSITQKDQNNLIVNFSWTVNNTNTPLDKDTSKISALAKGEFRRASR